MISMRIIVTVIACQKKVTNKIINDKYSITEVKYK